MIKKIPMRSCVITKERLPKKELIRIVRTPEDKIEIDLIGKINGRGAYLKKDKDVVLKAKQNKTLERHLEVIIPESIYDELIQLIEGEDNE